jgi:hypothetical protein
LDGKYKLHWMLVAHACNPSYLGDRDQEDHGLKPGLGKQFTRPFLEKNPSQKRDGGMAQGVGLEVKPQYCKRKKKKYKLPHVLLGGVVIMIGGCCYLISKLCSPWIQYPVS